MAKALQRAIVKALPLALTRLPLGRCGCETVEGVWYKWQGSNYMVSKAKNFGHHQWQIYDLNAEVSGGFDGQACRCT